MKSWDYPRHRALVTGASAGLGAIFAEKLAARGSPLVLSARRRERLEELALRLRTRYGVEVEVIPADLAMPGEAGALWEAANRHHPIGLLVNNAGFGAQGRFETVPVERHREMIEVNCTAVLELAHAAILAMRPRGVGGIINLASVAAFQPVPLLASYAATKAFVLHLSEALWVENRDAGIRVLALCPGRTPTEFQQVAGSGSTRGAFGVRSPEQVVEAGLRAFEEGRSSVVPGVENGAAAWVARAIPRGVLLRAMRAVVRGVGAKERW